MRTFGRGVRRAPHVDRDPVGCDDVDPWTPTAVPLVERGSFAHGACDACDWSGPARRARDVARRDAGLHLLVGCAPDVAASTVVRQPDVATAPIA